jgi:integrase/recombinase XerD
VGNDVPVEYAVAVDRYLGAVALGEASRRVYRISLRGWAWPLVGRAVPDGRARRGAAPPVVPLALLDDPVTPAKLAEAFAARAAATDERTVNRELSVLRSATAWWREQGWISEDPAAGLRHRPRARHDHPRPGARPPDRSPGLTTEQVTQLFRLPVALREHAFWRLLYDTGASAAEILALDADRLDLTRHRTRPRPGYKDDDPAVIEWQDATSQALRWLLTGRTWGPVFLTGRRAPAGSPAGDVCRVTGQGRMSYRRSAEIFTAATQPLDPAGRGWTLHQLSAAGREV